MKRFSPPRRVLLRGSRLTPLHAVLIPFVLATLACRPSDSRTARDGSTGGSAGSGGAGATVTGGQAGHATSATGDQGGTSTSATAGQGGTSMSATAGQGGTSTEGATTAWKEPTFDPQALPTNVPSVEIVIADDARAALDAAPFYGDDVTGTFVDGDGNVPMPSAF